MRLPVLYLIHVTFFILLHFLDIMGNPNSVEKNSGIQQIKIINGTIAHHNTTQYQVSIRNRRDDGHFFGTGHICGGSLISKNVVLSAAHCFINQTFQGGEYLPIGNFTVVMGNLDRFEEDNSITFDILEAFYPHNAFNVKTFEDDIALLILNDSVPFDYATQKPILLNGGCIAHDHMCQATGWGLTEEEELSHILLTVDVPVIDPDICRKESVYGEHIYDGMLCAGYMAGQYDACQGDSGGPLVCDEMQVGIISWGDNCALPQRPGVYTNISFYKNWILQTVNNYGAAPPIFIQHNCSVSKGNSRYNEYYIFIILIITVFIILEKH